MSKKPAPVAILFSNGNVLAFNAEGKQINKIQKKALFGLVKFRDEYPDADIWFCKWDSEGIKFHEKLTDGFINKLRRADS